MQVPDLRLILPTTPLRPLRETSFIPYTARCFQVLTRFGGSCGVLLDRPVPAQRLQSDLRLDVSADPSLSGATSDRHK